MTYKEIVKRGIHRQYLYARQRTEDDRELEEIEQLHDGLMSYLDNFAKIPSDDIKVLKRKIKRQEKKRKEFEADNG